MVKQASIMNELEQKHQKYQQQIDINPNLDTDYYNFFLAVSKFMQANGVTDWLEGSALILQRSKSINTSYSIDNKSNLQDSKQMLLGQQLNSRNQLSKQYLGVSTSFHDKMNDSELYNQNESISQMRYNQRKSTDEYQMIENNPYIQNLMKQEQQKLQKGYVSNHSAAANEDGGKDDRKKQRTNAKRNLIQTITNNLESIENKLVDIEESQNNITRLNISDLDLSNISHGNMNNTTLVSNLNVHLNQLKYMNQTKNELKAQLGFDNSFLDQALNQTTQDHTNASHWQQNTHYISIKEQEQEDEEEGEEEGQRDHDNVENRHPDEDESELKIEEKSYEENISHPQFNKEEKIKKQNQSFQQKKENRSLFFNNSQEDNDYTQIPQQDTSMSYEKLFSNQTRPTTITGTPSPFSHIKISKEINTTLNDTYHNKSLTNQYQSISAHLDTSQPINHNNSQQQHFQSNPQQKLIALQHNMQYNSNLSSASQSKVNLSSHLEKYNKSNTSQNQSLSNFNSTRSQTKQQIQPAPTDFMEYTKQNRDQFQNSTLKGMSSIYSFNPQKSQLLASYEKQFQQFNRRPSHESDLSHTLGRSELNSYSLNQPVLLQSKQKHNVSFGENSVQSLDENEMRFKMQSQCFVKWVHYVNNRRQLKWEKEEQIRKIILALEYYQSMTQQKVLVMLKGYNMLVKERRTKEELITLKCQKNLKQKYLQLFLLNYCNLL